MMESYTPAMLAAHEARKARLARFAAASRRLLPRPTSIPVVAPEPVPPKRRQYESAHRPMDISMASRIIRIVAGEFGLTVAELTGPKRRDIHVTARFVAIGLMLEMTPMSYPAIGRRFGRDHTTILNAKHRSEALFAEEAIRNRVDQIKAEIAG